MGRYSNFTPSTRQSRRKGLQGLGDVSCERALLANLANQYFYALGSGDSASLARVPELKRAFERAYLTSSSATEGTLTQTELLGYLQAYLVEQYPALFDEVNSLRLNETDFSEWALSASALRAPSTYMTVAQAEAAMLACATPVVDPAIAAAEAQARAERERIAREAAIQNAAEAAARVAEARAEAERLAAAARTEAERIAAAQAREDADSLAEEAVATINPRLWATLGPLDPRISALLRTGGVLNPGTGSGSGSGTGETPSTTNYIPWVIGGGLLVAALLVTSAKSSKAKNAVLTPEAT